MKKYLGLFMVLSITFFVNANITKAEGTNFSVGAGINPQYDGQNDNVNKDTQIIKKEEVKNQIEVIREEAKQKMEALRESIKNEKDIIKAKIKELRIAGREKALERFDKAIERITDLKNNVNEKIAELQAKGIAVVDAKAFVATAETKLAGAKSKIVEINALLVVSINELTLENKTKLRTLAQDTQNLIVEAHRALRDAVKSLKAALKVKMEAENSNNE